MKPKNSLAPAEALQRSIDVILETSCEINDANDIIEMFVDMIADVLASAGNSKETNRAYALMQAIRRELKVEKELLSRLRDRVGMLSPEGGAR